MKRLGLKDRISRYIDMDRPPSAGPIDFEIRALGGGTTSTILLKELPPKGPTLPEQRIAELEEEINRLRSEVAYYRTLTDKALMHVVPMLQLHSTGLSTAIDRAQAGIGHVLSENRVALHGSLG